MELTFKTETILAKLKTNREEHLKIVQEAQEGFRERWVELLAKALEDARGGKKIKPSLHLSVPDNHVDDFDRAIEMFEMTEDDEVILEEGDFQAYIRNEWNWQHGFLVSNSTYSAFAASLIDD